MFFCSECFTRKEKDNKPCSLCFIRKHGYQDNDTKKYTIKAAKSITEKGFLLIPLYSGESYNKSNQILEYYINLDGVKSQGKAEWWLEHLSSKTWFRKDVKEDVEEQFKRHLDDRNGS